MKESYPLETAEFAVSARLYHESAFHWWIPHTLKKRDRIVAAVKHRLVKKNFKYGHHGPNTVQEAYELDKRNGNTRWRDAIAKEMKNVIVAFRILESDDCRCCEASFSQEELQVCQSCPEHCARSV